mgnify:CR=1 FL=1
MQQTNTRRPGEALLCGSIGGTVYYAIELTWRGHSHWTMALLGGVLFVILGDIGRHLGEGAPLWLQATLGGTIVTACELSAGIWINLVLGLDVWDYSRVPFNLLGQICLPYSLLWVPLSAGAIRLDRRLRRLLHRGGTGGKLTEHS